MIIDIYKSLKADNSYLSVPEGTIVSKIEFAADIDPDQVEVKLFKPGIELDPDKPLMGLDQADINRQIEARGYAIHGACFEASISLSGSGFM